MAFAGDFIPVLAKHSNSFSLVDAISVGVDRMQRNFEPMQTQVEAWQIALGKLGRGGKDDEVGKPLIAFQRVKVPPDKPDYAEASTVSVSHSGQKAIRSKIGGSEGTFRPMSKKSPPMASSQ
jgi:hypothetical protein